MKSVTIHGIDTDLDQKLMEKAAEFGLSQNRTIKLILEDSLIADKRARRRNSFSELFGTWSAKEKTDFENRIKELEIIDSSDWKK